MYILVIVALAVCGLALIATGLTRKRPGILVAGVSLLAATVLFFSLLSFWGEMLWFDSLGFSARFWKEMYVRLGVTLIGALAGALILYLWTLPVHAKPWLRRCLAVTGAALGGFWGSSGWVPFLAWLYRVPGGSVDPVWGRDIGFYLFVLPFYDRIFCLLLCLGVVSLLVALGGCLGARRGRRGYVLGLNRDRLAGRSKAVRVALGGILLVLAWGSYLYAYHFMYSKFGAVNGPGWTDVHLRIPAAGVLAALGVLMSAWTFLPVLRRKQAATGQDAPAEKHVWTPAMLFALAWVMGMFLAPRLAQWLRVEPNEITFERPYIENNIRFTRQAFGLDRIEERQFPAHANITQSTLDRNQQMLSEIRLWDWRALKAVHKQFQEIRLYYEFQDIDVDRYTIGGRYRQVMLSAREMQTASLPAQSRTFVNERFKYTHGYGITMTPVSEFTAEGLPNFSIKDIPPRSAFPELHIVRPEIYFGELTQSHVYVNSSELEFNYPKGDTNEYSRYAGHGGIPIQNLWRRFVFGWMFDGTRFLVSSYIQPDSRILFRRGIQDRVLSVAPFLMLDGDPYITLVDGRLYWILDAYTVSSWYPYSRPFSSNEVIDYTEGKQRRIISRVAPELDGMNYVRNSVKAVVDAYDGTVTLYVFDPQDPVLRVWRNAFPDLFRTRKQMPAGLISHIRYPIDMLLAQGLMYQKYHMTDPQVFYNQEDLWVRATEKYYSEVQPIEPYYIVWKTSESQMDEFVLILPFTPKNRQVMIGWVAGMCDADHYGRILAYKFPKERQVLGPQQMETKIDQDRHLSAQLTLWDQRGSRVIRGDVLVIPIDSSLLYVEPIYLQAETAAYPELRLVAVMQGETLSYAPSFGEALQGLIRGQPLAEITGASVAATPGDYSELARKANEAFERYLQLQADQKFADAARELETLRDILKKMAGTQPR